MIEVKHLTKRYGDQLAVDDLSFKIEEGHIYGLLGPNGAGKSTTMNIVTGYLSPTSGTVVVDGHDILEEPEAARACIGYLPEQPPLYLDMTVHEYLLFAAELKKVKKAERTAQVTRAVRRTGLAKVEGRLIRNLSKGYRQRVGVAQALLGAPKLIILDEPTVGLDPAQVIEVRRLIKELGKTHTVVLSSHILSEVQAICDQELIIAHGRLVANGAPDKLGEKLGAKGVLKVSVLGGWQSVQKALAHLSGVESLEKESEAGGETSFVVHCRSGADLRGEVSRALAGAGCAVLNMAADTLSLEDVFLQLTQAPEKEEKPARRSLKERLLGREDADEDDEASEEDDFDEAEEDAEADGDAAAEAEDDDFAEEPLADAQKAEEAGETDDADASGEACEDNDKDGKED